MIFISSVKCYTEAISNDGQNGAYYLKRCNARLKKEDFSGMCFSKSLL